MTVLLQLDSVSKFYGALKAVDAVNLTVGDGEALGVIGPNGAGKSTMFNLITGDVAPTAGRVRENWERLKVEQEGRAGVFHDVPENLPALLQARKVQRRAAGATFAGDPQPYKLDHVEDDDDETDEDDD